jgi:hypothetical protein
MWDGDALLTRQRCIYKRYLQCAGQFGFQLGHIK